MKTVSSTTHKRFSYHIQFFFTLQRDCWCIFVDIAKLLWKYHLLYEIPKKFDNWRYAAILQVIEFFTSKIIRELENKIEHEGKYYFSFRWRKIFFSCKVIVEILREKFQPFICMDWPLTFPIRKYFICFFNRSFFSFLSTLIFYLLHILSEWGGPTL